MSRGCKIAFDMIVKQPEYVTQSEFARLCKLSRQRIYQAKNTNLIAFVEKKGIDINDPRNQYFRDRALAIQIEQAATAPGEIVGRVQVGAEPEESVKEETPDKLKPQKKRERLGDAPRPFAQKEMPPSQEVEFDTFQKVYEETRYKKIRADREVLAYAKDAEAVVDVEALRHKLGAFTDFLYNRLIYLPEDIADMLWMEANGSEDPERVIRKRLSERIAEIIREAKKAAEKVVPPDGGVKYVMIALKDIDDSFEDQTGTDS